MVHGKNIAALIIAAGLSSRMGSFKPLLPLGEGTVIEKSVALFRMAGIEDVTVVTGHRSKELLPVLTPLGVNLVFNRDYSKGMFSSVKAGVASLKPSLQAFFFLPGDIPFVQPQTVISMLETFSKGRSGIIYPCFKGERGHPPLISTAYKDSILSWHGEGGLRALLQEIETDAVDVEVEDGGILQDLDTPEDYLRLYKSFGSYTVPTEEQCLMILNKSRVSEQVLRHCRAVALVAEKIALSLHAAGHKLDLALVASAALLHDIAKGEKNHAHLGAKRLCQLGYPAVAEIVAKHMDIVMDGQVTIDEAAVVYLADKLVKRDKAVTLEQRFKHSIERYSSNPIAREAVSRRLCLAMEIKKEIERKISQPLENVIK
ncbi:DVU_1551 family NTP transferase [Desulfofalx alkaliphila]|uniref:DVU_1551 family NTP transferase n=1 Tax=Desulfofalx alkaliphila TaxID=105483 RepID=UPI0004E1062E|nr:NTP transferase domain-containing protein [Desulfofalx alkaliphila]